MWLLHPGPDLFCRSDVERSAGWYRERGATSFFVAERDWLDALWIVDEAQRRSGVAES